MQSVRFISCQRKTFFTGAAALQLTLEMDFVPTPDGKVDAVTFEGEICTCGDDFAVHRSTMNKYLSETAHF